MIRERSESVKVSLTLRSLMVLAFATSIDALMVGVSFSCLGRPMGWREPTCFGVITALLSWSGTLLGRKFGNMLNGRCGLVGGIMLIAIGIKVAFAG
jgi:putative Mn2+ efflux pump MntP